MPKKPEKSYSLVVDPGELTLVYPDGSKHKVLLGEVFIDWDRAHQDMLKELGLSDA